MMWLAISAQAVCAIISIALVGHWGSRPSSGREPFGSVLAVAALSVTGLAACIAAAWPA